MMPPQVLTKIINEIRNGALAFGPRCWMRWWEAEEWPQTNVVNLFGATNCSVSKCGWDVFKLDVLDGLPVAV